MKESNEINSLPIQSREEFIIQKEHNNNESKQKYDKQENEENNVNIEVLDEIDEVRSFGDESENLLKEKKNKLQNRFKYLHTKFVSFGDIKLYDIPTKYSNEGNSNESNQNESEIDEDIQEKKAAKRIILEERCGKIFIFAFLFIIFYLIGIFQLLDLFDSTKKETGIIFKSFFFDEQRRSNETFLELYINSCFKNVPEFDFAFITSIIGSFPLNFMGFFISSLLFTVFNSFLFLNFIRLDFEKTKV